jgi:hypothetical protein
MDAAHWAFKLAEADAGEPDSHAPHQDSHEIKGVTMLFLVEISKRAVVAGGPSNILYPPIP